MCLQLLLGAEVEAVASGAAQHPAAQLCVQPTNVSASPDSALLTAFARSVQLTLWTPAAGKQEEAVHCGGAPPIVGQWSA